MSNASHNTNSLRPRMKLAQGHLPPQAALLMLAAAMLVGMFALGYSAAAAGVASTERKSATVDTGVGRHSDGPAAVRTFRTSAIGFLTSTLGTLDFIPGQTYVIASGNSRQTADPWVYVNFNGMVVSASDLRAWLECGYNPVLRTQAEWASWCPQFGNEINKAGPTEYWLGWPDPSEPADPNNGYTDYRLRWGEDKQGWWLSGNRGSTRSTCSGLADAISRMNGNDYELPLFDVWTDEGSNSRFHLRALPTFLMQNSAVECNRRDPITGQTYDSWYVEGMFKAKY